MYFVLFSGAMYSMGKHEVHVLLFQMVFVKVEYYLQNRSLFIWTIYISY